jgi:hypothetical protein
VTTTARGYGAPHQAERQRWQQALNQGLAIQCACAGECLRHHGRCTKIITIGTRWDLMHNPDRTAYLGPGCVPCNRTDGAIRSNGVVLAPLVNQADRW